MTTTSGNTAISPPGPPAESAPPAVQRAVTPSLAPGALGLALLALGWFAAMLRSGQAEITSSDIQPIVIAMAALALPGLISASLVGGAASAVVLANVLTRRGVHRSTPRFAAAVGAGLVTGLVAALVVALSYGGGDMIMVLAGTVAAAATVGGIAGGVRSVPVVAAVVAAGLSVFAINSALNYFKDPVLSLYGFGNTDQSQLNALNWFSRTGSLSQGLAAGLVVFGYLRWARRRAAALPEPARPPRWPAYLIAGAGPGLLLLAAEILTHTAGARLLAAAGALSETDQGLQNSLGESRFDQALLVLFVGALTATISFGRTLRPAETEDEDEDELVDEVTTADGIGIRGEPTFRDEVDDDDDELEVETGTDRSTGRRPEPDAARS
jgi:hypothetical protein